MSTTIFETADGISLLADILGPDSGRPIILAHGGGQTRHAWKDTAERLAGAGWRAIALDLRGHGNSDWSPGGDYRIDRFVEDLLSLARDLKRRPVVVGASLGGIAALLAEGESSSSVFSAIVLVDIAPKIEMQGVEQIVSFMGSSLQNGFASLAEAAEAVATYLPHRRPPRDLEGLRKNLRRGEDGRYRWHWDPAFILGERRAAASRDPERMSRAAAALGIPTLLVRGQNSELVSQESVRHFLELVPHAVFKDVSGAGHMVAGDRNDLFGDAVLAFLETLA